MMMRPRATVRALLLASLAFALLTLLSQILMGDSETGSIMTETISSHRRIAVVNNNNNSSNQLIVDDLRLTERSLLKELKKLEIKRRRVLRELRHLQSQCDEMRVKHAQMSEKNLLTRHKLIHNTLRLERVNTELDQRFNTINLLKDDSRQHQHLSDHLNNVSECFNCLDLTNCHMDSPLRVYLHHDSLSHTILNQLNRTLISSSIYLTTNPNDRLTACLVAVVLNQANVEFINEGRSNLLLLDLVNSSFNNFSQIDPKRLASSILVSTRHHSTNINSQVSLLINFPFGIQFDHSSSSTTRGRVYLLTYHQSSTDSDGILNSITLSDKRVVIDTKCVSSQYNLCFNVSQRLDWLSKSKYTLIMGHQEVVAIRLVEVLKSNTIPVVINSEQMKLPLSDLIDWRMVIVRLPARQLPRLVHVLDAITESEYLTRQQRARNIFTAYFATTTWQLRTIVAAVLHRIEKSPPTFNTDEKELITHKGGETMTNDDDDENLVEDDDEETTDEYLGEINQAPLASPHYVANFTRDIHSAWNVYYYPFNLFPSTPFDQSQASSESRFESYDSQIEEMDANFSIGGGDGRVFQHHLSGNYPEEQFTMVILSYKRENILSDLLEKYLRLPYLHSIVVVWNSDQDMSYRFTSKFHFYLVSSRLRVVKSKTNSLCNRFKPYPSLIETDAVLSMDDDTYLRADEILLAFRVWRENRDRLVGLPARYHTWNATARQFEYKSYLTCEYSMVLTGAAFYHRFYAYMFTYGMSNEIRAKVDELMNCEDIAFNMLVAHITRRPPIKVSTKYSFYCKECDWVLKSDVHDHSMAANMSVPAVSQRAGHYEKRSECVRYFTSVYGYNPLLYSQYRADSVLYKTRLGASVQRCFKYV